MKYFLEYESIKDYSRYVGQKFYWNRDSFGNKIARRRMNEFMITSYSKSRDIFCYRYLDSGLTSDCTCAMIFEGATFIDDE